jgi:hypothetical protein
MDRRLAVIGGKRFGFGVGEGWARCGLRRLEGTRSDMGVKGVGRWSARKGDSQGNCPQAVVRCVVALEFCPPT